VELTIYDVVGREVQVLERGRLLAGEHDLIFDAAGPPEWTILMPAANRWQSPNM